MRFKLLKMFQHLIPDHGDEIRRRASLHGALLKLQGGPATDFRILRGNLVRGNLEVQDPVPGLLGPLRP